MAALLLLIYQQFFHEFMTLFAEYLDTFGHYLVIFMTACDTLLIGFFHLLCENSS